MINSRGRVVSKLVSYIERYHPEALLLVRPMDVGRFLCLPSIVILERRCNYTGLALWVTPSITDFRMEQIEKFEKSGLAVAISDDYVALRSCLTSYLTMNHPGDYATDSVQLDLIKGRNRVGVLGCIRSRYRKQLTSSDIDMLNHIVEFVMRKYTHAVIMPTFGSESGPDITIFSDKFIHRGLAIWLSESPKCYDLYGLSSGQFNKLLDMASRSYLTIASLSYQDITDVIDFYVMCEYEDYGCLPKFCEEDCE